MAVVNRRLVQSNAKLRDTLNAHAATITALNAALDTIVAKLNLDGGVTDVNYANSAVTSFGDTVT